MREATGVFNVYDADSFEAEVPAESSPAFERGIFSSCLNWRVLAIVVLGDLPSSHDTLLTVPRPLRRRVLRHPLQPSPACSRSSGSSRWFMIEEANGGVF